MHRSLNKVDPGIGMHESLLYVIGPQLQVVADTYCAGLGGGTSAKSDDTRIHRRSPSPSRLYIPGHSLLQL
jgi:hypothetical protein